jgi:branched-chain amino acid transport system substrate-binding protein
VRSSRSELVTLVFACLLCACSLTTVQRSECTPESDTCQATFGVGSVCGEDGFCVRPTHPRCDRTYPVDLFSNAEYSDRIIIGSLMDRHPTTGPSQIVRENAIELAVRGANDDGGIDDRLFGLVMCNIHNDEDDVAIDGMTQQEAAISAAQFLANDLRLPAIIGPSGSADTLAVFAALEGTNTLVMSPAATSVELIAADNTSPTQDQPGLLWRTAPTDSFQAALIASDMESRGVTNVAVVYAEDAYGEGIANAFMADFSGTIMDLPFASTNDFQRSEAGIAAIRSTVEEILFVSSASSHGVTFVETAAVDSMFGTKRIFLTDSAASTSFATMTMDVMSIWPSIRGTRPRLPGNTVFALFRAAYMDAFDGVDPGAFSFTAHAYDAAWLVLAGIAWAVQQEDAINGTTIARGLRRTTEGDPLELKSTDFGDIVDAFSMGESVDVTGSSGDLEFDTATEEVPSEFEIWTPDLLVSP